MVTGIHAPLLATSTGKPTLASLNTAERKKLLSSYYPDCLDAGGNLHKSYEKDLGRISKEKYAVSEGEWIPEIGNSGITLIGSAGTPIGGIGITVPMTRRKTLKIKSLGRNLVKTKKDLEAVL